MKKLTLAKNRFNVSCKLSPLLTVGGIGDGGTALARVNRCTINIVIASETKHMINTN